VSVATGELSFFTLDPFSEVLRKVQWDSELWLAFAQY